MGSSKDIDYRGGNCSRLRHELRSRWHRGLVAGLCWREPCSEPRLRLFDGELFRIKAPANPLDALQILGMRGIRQHGEKVLVTPGTAAVLGRAVPFPGNTGGVATCLKRTPGSPNEDRVFPVVAEVIGVGKAADAGVQHLVQGNRSSSATSSRLSGSPYWRPAMSK